MARESKQTPGDSEGQGSLVGCCSWGRKESDTTERLNNNKSRCLLLPPASILVVSTRITLQVASFSLTTSLAI